MGNGWIKLHRKLLDKGYWNKSQYVHLWVHLLLIANHKQKEFMWNGSLIMVKEGQVITGRKELSNATGIPETTIERILEMLESEHQIGQQKTNKYRLITILNWEQYQNRTPERTTSGQQADTNKNDKNENNTSEFEDEPRRDVPESEDEDQPLKRKPKYPHSKEVFSWFPAAEPSWKLNKTELSHAELLFVRGEKNVRDILKFCRKHADEEFLPSWETPSLLERNWNKIIKFAERNGL